MHLTSSALDPLALRRALGMFATGVAVVTARTTDGRQIGLTINSFASVSLAPPLILWSLDRQQSSRADFEAAEFFAVNVLQADQQALSQRFAQRGQDKFDGLGPLPEGQGGAPLLPDCLAWFECRNLTRHEGGDHLIFIGEVLSFDRQEGEPLVYFGGAYRALGPV